MNNPPNRCVLNVAVGGWYPFGQARLRYSLEAVNDKATRLFWKDFPQSCPPHSELPYGFKSYAMQEAVQKGFTTLLWLDASCWAAQPLEPLWEKIETDGHLFSREQQFPDYNRFWTAGQWLKDEALETLGLNRDEALQIPLLGGMMMGVCIRNERSSRWLKRFIEICQDKKTLPGPMRNINGSVCADPRCLGHVADQAVAAVLAHQLGMELTVPPEWRDWDRPNPSPKTFILSRGM